MKTMVVHVQCPDIFVRAGAVAVLSRFPQIRASAGTDAETVPDVHLVVAERFDRLVEMLLEDLARRGPIPVALALSHIEGVSVTLALRLGVRAMLMRPDLAPERLVAALTAASRGDGSLPVELLTRLRSELATDGGGRGEELGILPGREREVLMLAAEGYSTVVIARKLGYSERTIKAEFRSIVQRLKLRNRTHSVAYAIRNGYI
ncbi:response regulator transcription factor [Streptomyces yaizuensis]|uniref:Response regulator transcription factor n=2 Tax=Streptomyces yaizuensis TaxID=2989713 RepID=A0ABQ5NY39_9ACTN|nr:response regulator transcription factor [Streptomyces sp. YSPA8]